MSREYQGRLLGEGLRFGIVVSRFNQIITKRLLEGAMDGLLRHGVAEEAIEVSWVPGAFEIPLIAKKMAGTDKYAAIICLAAVIRGETPHFEYVATEVSKGIALVALETGIPAIYGVVTADSLDQAMERAGAKAGNKGYIAAESALEMANLLRSLEGS